MKYAITGPRGRIIRFLDEPQDGTVEVTDELAAAATAAEEPMWLLGGELKTQEEAVEIRIAEHVAAAEAAYIESLTPEQLVAYEASKNPVPQEIANWRARAVLEIAGLLPQVETLIDAMTGPEGVIVKAAWANGAALLRHGATVQSITPSLSLTEEQVDDLFRQAAALEV